MEAKKYTGKSFQNAVEKAKMEMGEDIIIIDTREIMSGGFLSEEKKLVEILVSPSDGETSGEDNVDEPEQSPEKTSSSPVTKQRKANASVLPKKVSKNLQYTYLSNELEKLNDYVSKLLFADFPKILIDYQKILVKTGVTESDAVKLISLVQNRLKGIPVLSKSIIMGSLEAATQMYLKGRKLIRNYEQKIIAVVGPAGVGKTNSIMKLATNKQIIGERRIAIVSTDCYRMAASETLSKFSKLTSIPVHETRNAEEFSSVIAKLNKADIILVDTPGNNIQENKYFSEMETFFQKVPNIKKLLVLSNSLDQRIIENYLDEYRKMDITGMIITKIDELNYPGKILSVTMATNLPVYYLGTGQSIPGDILENRDGLLWKLLEERIKELLNE